jgi:hypothetical protein
MWDEVDVAQDPEGHLLEISTSMDISGRRLEDISPALRTDVLARYPRLGLGYEFIRHFEFIGYFEDHAKRMHLCPAAKFIRSGWAAANRLER